jgi:uncharacterized membrane protein
VCLLTKFIGAKSLCVKNQMASSSKLPGDNGEAAKLRARLAAFLPAMRAANEELEKKRAADPASIDVEHLADPHAPHIEMVSARRQSSEAHPARHVQPRTTPTVRAVRPVSLRRILPAACSR